MRNRAAKYRVLFILLVLGMYLWSLGRNFTERERRSLDIQEEVQESDQAHVSVRIVEANPTASEITARLSFRLSGNIAKDAVTPAVDLRLLLNSIRGSQYFDYPKGRRINPIVAVFTLEGNANRYPIDRHQADVWIILTTPRQVPESPPPSRKINRLNIPAEMSGQLELAIGELQRQVPLSLELSASIPGWISEARSMRLRPEKSITST